MPAYRFSWDAFDDTTIGALARGEGWSSSDGDPRAWFGARVKRPNDELVRRHKATLAKVWLPGYAGSVRIVEHLQDALIGPMGKSPASAADAARYVDSCRNSSRLRRFVLDAMLRFGDQDRKSDAEGGDELVPRFAVLKPASQTPDGREAHDYQRAAWDRLSAHLAEGGAARTFQGLLVMPTGSGKTYTAVRWLTENVLARGGRVLWLAHRAELLGQAARDFHALAAHAGSREAVRVRVVSGQHCATSQIDPADDVLICSIASLSRRLDLVDDLVKDDRTFIVIDEAHHAIARTYQDVIGRFEGKAKRLLGLTATPTRTAKDEQPVFAKLFGDRVLHAVRTADLIERGFLARPQAVTVETHANVEDGLTEHDVQHMARFGGLSEDWLARIGEMTPRNRVIVDHYVQNREKYGKTVVFAVNVLHASTLTDMFTKAAVTAEYVASYRLERDEKDNVEILKRFRDRNGGLDVLVNVQMVTEGVDVPAVRTVFLTRPTQSEILLRQMVGRALRGPAAGGNTHAWVVSFEDHWERFRDWQGQMALVLGEPPPGVQGGDSAPPVDPTGGEPPPAIAPGLPVEVFAEVLRGLRLEGTSTPVEVFAAIHSGWYLLARMDEGTEVRRLLPVHEHQRECWEELVAHTFARRGAPAESPSDEQVEQVWEEYFGDCDAPAPGLDEVRAILDHARLGGQRPEYRPLEERAFCDPMEVARRIHTGDLRESERKTLLAERYTALAQAIFPTAREFQAAVSDALYVLENPGAATTRPRAVPIFQPRPEQTLRPGPTHDLQRLFRETMEEGARLLGTAPTSHVDLVWTRRIIKGWYGMAYWEKSTPNGHGRIKMNVLLDSPDVSEATIRFLLWHEFLHLHLQQLHTPIFRDLERKWPGFQAADRELDTLNDKFGVQYW